MADSFEVLTSVDIGSHTIKGMVFAIENNDTQVLAYSRVKSRGYEQGELKDIAALRESLESLLKDLSGQLPRRMESYFVISFVEKTTFLGEEIKTITLGDGSIHNISEENVSELFSRISSENGTEYDDASGSGDGFELVSSSRTILHVIPQKYILDGVKSVLNPIEMEASTLGIKASVITIESTIKESLSNAFAGVVSGEKPLVYSSPFVSSMVVLNGMEKERGVVCLDLGHSYTSICSYMNGSVFYMKSIEQGIKQVIKDIAQVFHTSFDEAERLLNTYGKVAMKDTSSETVNYVTLDGKTTKQITTAQLSIVIYAKVREILNLIKREIRVVTTKMFEEGENGIPGGFVITGGGAKIEGMIEFIREVFKVSVRIGHIGTGNFIPKSPDELEDPVFSGCFGNIYWYKLAGGLENIDTTQAPEKKRKRKVSHKVEKEGKGTFDKILNFLKKLV